MELRIQSDISCKPAIINGVPDTLLARGYNMFKKHLNWETAQYLVLFLTVAGQVLIGVNYYWGQGAWLIANAITVTRNVKLERPRADKVQGWFMFALTCGLIVANVIAGR